MKTKDARSLSQEAKEALRKRAVSAVVGGMRQSHVARTDGSERVCGEHVGEDVPGGWEEALGARRKGPAKGFGKKVTERQERECAIGHWEVPGAIAGFRSRCGRERRFGSS